jgi:DNA-binding transcriptional MerR regulator
MHNREFTSAQTLCSSYNIELSFLDALHTMRLIEIKIIEHHRVVYHDQISELERIIRLYKELNLNLEGIDVVLNLLEKEQQLQNEVVTLQNRLRLYESD